MKNRPFGHRPRSALRALRKSPKMTPAAHPALKKYLKAIGSPDWKPFSPDAFQLEAVAAIRKGDCLVSAPTGAGKTWIALEAIEHIRKTSANAWYASPLKALTNSKYIEFIQRFGQENVGILTGDRKENPEAPIIVGTTEILRNQLYDAMHRGTDLGTDLVVLDEAHFLGDPERGVVWEEVMIYLPPRIPLLLLSATINNAEQIAAWLESLRSKPCFVIKETKRPVPLMPLFFHPTGTLYPLRASINSNKLHPKVREYASAKKTLRLSPPGKLPSFSAILRILKKFRLLPAIFFMKSRADCDFALDLCDGDPISDEDLKTSISKQIAEVTEQIPRLGRHRQMWHLQHLAVGAHHSGQLPAWKLLIESLMSKGLLNAVFATSTVAAGVNFPARSVVFMNSDKFNGVEFMPLTPTEFHQMTGRAGRRGMDRIGFAVAMPGKYMDTRLMAELSNTPPGDVLSQIKINFSMTLNLLLSHKPEQIKLLLERSFANFLIRRASGNRGKASDTASAMLLEDFAQHFDFLIQTGYAESSGDLTEDGRWASQLRVDQPLVIAEGFRRKLFPDGDPVLLGALIAGFVNEREMQERFDVSAISKKLERAFSKTSKGIQPFRLMMMEHGFPTRPLSLLSCWAVYQWACGISSWEKILAISGLSDGDFSMLILRTTDNLRHIATLSSVFPKASDSASKAIELILRDPVVTFLNVAASPSDCE